MNRLEAEASEAMGAEADGSMEASDDILTCDAIDIGVEYVVRLAKEQNLVGRGASWPGHLICQRIMDITRVEAITGKKLSAAEDGDIAAASGRPAAGPDVGDGCRRRPGVGSGDHRE